MLDEMRNRTIRTGAISLLPPNRAALFRIA